MAGSRRKPPSTAEFGSGCDAVLLRDTWAAGVMLGVAGESVPSSEASCRSTEREVPAGTVSQNGCGTRGAIPRRCQRRACSREAVGEIRQENGIMEGIGLIREKLAIRFSVSDYGRPADATFLFSPPRGGSDISQDPGLAILLRSLSTAFGRGLSIGGQSVAFCSVQGEEVRLASAGWFSNRKL